MHARLLLMTSQSETAVYSIGHLLKPNPHANFGLSKDIYWEEYLSDGTLLNFDANSFMNVIDCAGNSNHGEEKLE